jgi:hypothetical protein
VPTRRKERVFFSYSHADKELLERLTVHLKQLERDGLIEPWHELCVAPGGEWAKEVERHIEQADLIFLLVSADFLASDSCWEVGVKRALERHEAGRAVVVPILLRPCDFSTAPFFKLQPLPRTRIPVTSWTDQDQAWTEITTELRKLIEVSRS